MAYGLTQSPLLVAATPSYFNTATSIAALGITGDITGEAWVNFASMPADRATIFGKNNAAGDGYATYAFELLKSGANYDLRVVMSISGTPEAVVSKTSWNPSTGTWYHVAFTRVSSTGACVITIDGVSAATNTSTTGATDASTAALTIGRFGTGGTGLSFDGRVSLVRVWDVQRSVATILANMCTVYGTATTNMQGEWSLDNVLTDASGNASTLTNVGTVVFATDTPSTCAVGNPIGKYVQKMQAVRRSNYY